MASKAVLAAVRDLIAADKDRGLTTQLVDISDRTKMKLFKGRAVTSPGNERQCKDAVDAIYAIAKPDYLVLVDGPDVVPHLTLNNGTPGDGDASVPSDLPYASDAPYTSRDAANMPQSRAPLAAFLASPARASRTSSSSSSRRPPPTRAASAPTTWIISQFQRRSGRRRPR